MCLDVLIDAVFRRPVSPDDVGGEIRDPILANPGQGIHRSFDVAVVGD
jgi:hypothetical protein